MMTITEKHATKNSEWKVVGGSVLVALFLFFIDEGYYNFNWMLDIGNWIVFVVYVLMISFSSLVFHEIILRKYKGRRKGVLSVVLGTFALMSIIYGVIALF